MHLKTLQTSNLNGLTKVIFYTYKSRCSYKYIIQTILVHFIIFVLLIHMNLLLIHIQLFLSSVSLVHVHIRMHVHTYKFNKSKVFTYKTWKQTFMPSIHSISAIPHNQGNIHFLINHFRNSNSYPNFISCLYHFLSFLTSTTISGISRAYCH